MTIPARTAFRSAILAEAAIWPAALIVALLHLVPTQLSPVTDMVSEYALGRFGLLADTCFLAIGGSALALAVCLRRALQPTPAVKTATIALTVMATATFALPFFPTDPDRPSTVHGWIHLIAALLGMTSLIVAAAAIAVHYRTHVATPPPSTHIARLSLMCSAVMALNLALMLARWLPGLTERLLILAGMVWIAVISRFLRTKTLGGG
ncbi:DUF998 domain-containing protein [Streptomyces sp. NPDC047082]|uniref:DUF998 domain-containing protein n=1 Tax=Streptomyces sp. NPDC047082 TaxID=3155259 RepID=UPI0033EC734D